MSVVMRLNMRNIFALLLLLPIYAFACDNTLKPVLFINDLGQDRESSYIQFIIPHEFNNEVFDASFINLGSKNDFVATVPLNTRKVEVEWGKKYVDYIGSHQTFVRINRKMQNKFELELSYREKPREDGMIRACLTRYTYTFDELFDYSETKSETKLEKKRR
jgi:hypothetical protein